MTTRMFLNRSMLWPSFLELNLPDADPSAASTILITQVLTSRSLRRRTDILKVYAFPIC